MPQRHGPGDYISVPSVLVVREGLNMQPFRSLLAGLALFWTTAGGGGVAEASTIYTYGFEQTGYIVAAAPPFGGILPATLKGSFTGTSDAIDHISLGTLSAFHVEFGATNGAGTSASYSGVPDYFSFQVGDTNGSTLAFQAPLPLVPGVMGQACVGVAVAALCGGGTALGYVSVSVAGVVVFFNESTVVPTITLLSAINDTPVATTPIPGALLLFGTALGGIGAAGAMRRKIGA